MITVLKCSSAVPQALLHCRWRSLVLGPDAQMTMDSIAQFSKRDADAYPEYEEMLERIAAFIEPTIDEEPPNPRSNKLSDLWQLFKLGKRFRGLGSEMEEAIRVLTAPANHILDEWFVSEQLKTTLATDAIIGAMASPATPGTGYVLFHHVMGETNGKKGVWGYVRGGMGASLMPSLVQPKVLEPRFKRKPQLKKILAENGVACGVTLVDGTTFKAKTVASNLDCNMTFNRLVGQDHLDSDFLRRINRIRYDSASSKLMWPYQSYPTLKQYRKRPGPQHRGTIHICDDRDTIERAFDDAKYGRPSKTPVLECSIPSVVDDTVAPEGKHLMNMFIQYAPYNLATGSWDEHRDAFADRCFEIMDQYAPNFSGSVLERQVLAPPDIEQSIGMTGGHISQGEMTLYQLAPMRPVMGWANYRTPLRIYIFVVPPPILVVVLWVPVVAMPPNV